MIYGFFRWSWLDLVVMPTVAFRRVEYECEGCDETHERTEISLEWLGATAGLGFD
jgi:hypothetical protein